MSLFDLNKNQMLYMKAQLFYKSVCVKYLKEHINSTSKNSIYISDMK